MKYLKTDKKSQLKAEHSAANIDINGDGAADLLLTTQEGLELHVRIASPETTPYKYQCTVPWPEIDGCTIDQCIGQARFANFDLDGLLDMILTKIITILSPVIILDSTSKWQFPFHHFSPF